MEKVDAERADVATRPVSRAVAVAVPALWLASGIATVVLGQQYLDVTPLTPSRPAALDGIATDLDNRLVLLTTLVLYVATWIATAQVSLGPRRQALLVLLWSAPVLLAPPVLSADVYAYAELGWFQHVGADPYSSLLHSMPSSPFFDGTASWAGSATPYAPTALRLFWLAGSLAGFDPYWTPTVLRLLGILAVLATVPLAATLARQLNVSADRLALLIPLNPVLLLYAIGGIHQDAWALPLVLLAFSLALRPTVPWLLAGVAALALAGTVKQTAVLVGVGLVPLAAARLPMRLGRRVRLVAAAAVVVAAGIAATAVWTVLAGTGIGWLSASSTPGLRAMSPLGFATLAAGGDYPPSWMILGGVVVGALVGASAWVVDRGRDHVWKAGAFSAAVTYFGLVSFQPWYYLVSLPLLALTVRSSRVAFFAVLAWVFLLVEDFVVHVDMVGICSDCGRLGAVVTRLPVALAITIAVGALIWRACPALHLDGRAATARSTSGTRVRR